MTAQEIGEARRWVRVDRADGVVTLTLADPDRRNALTPPMVDELCAALDDAEASPEIGAVVTTGSGTAFCAGADLSHLGSARREGLLAIYRGFLRLAASPLFTVSAVNGAAVGAGMNMALATDVRIAAESARFDCRFLALGLHPGGGHGYMLERAVGRQGAAAMLLGGDVLDGREAERVGLAWRCVPDGTLAGAAAALAGRAASYPREVSRRAKATLAAGRTVADHDAAVALELGEQLWSLDQPDFAARLATLRARSEGR